MRHFDHIAPSSAVPPVAFVLIVLVLVFAIGAWAWGIVQLALVPAL